MSHDLADQSHRSAAVSTLEESADAEWGVECALPYLIGLLAGPETAIAACAAAPVFACRSDPLR